MAVTDLDIVIVGAGPYGLSLAAHLRHHGQRFRIFGLPMRSWSHHMPRGMSLKSEGFASNLSDPGHTYPLKNYCAERGIPYADVGHPVHIDTFTGYGREFQKRFVPTLEETHVTSVRQVGKRFEVTTETGETVSARHVVVATGISYFGYIPPLFAGLPESLVTHGAQHSDLGRFKGRKVAVLGAGASALDIAMLAQQAGAQVELIARRAAILFHNPPSPEPRPLIERLMAPRSGLGLGWRSRMCTDIPLVFHALPASLRLKAVQSHLGPAPCWFTRDGVEGKLPMRLGTDITDVRAQNGGVTLVLRDKNQVQTELDVDHVIAATGYHVELSRLPFFDEALRSRVAVVEDSPVLNRQFESSIPGLYFVGVSAAYSFGPMLRFAYGADYTATRLAAYLRSRLPAKAASRRAELEAV
jgi:cation diffusion facilitator CzcD-associated flavoprotein CzcO